MGNRREFCCSECGLIWFGEEGVYRADGCPECNAFHFIYACDTFGYAYACESIKKILEMNGKQIHYAKHHPFYKKNKVQVEE